MARDRDGDASGERAGPAERTPPSAGPGLGHEDHGEGAGRVKGTPLEPARVARLPSSPGVYLFRDGAGEILYVGKAKHLRARVRSYLGSGVGVKTRELVRRARTVETFVVGSEAEALILEANLVKEHQPRFNIHLRDDKKYPYIKVTVEERFPRAYLTRRVRPDGARYFGPFVAVGRVRAALELLKKRLGVRSCRYDLPAETPSRPCLDYDIGRCHAPCAGMQGEDAYRSVIDDLVRVLEGDVAKVQAKVESDMHKAAFNMEFERAAQLRDVRAGLDGIAGQQRVHVPGGGDQDVVGLARDGTRAVAVRHRIRRGVLTGQDARFLTGGADDADEVLIGRFASHAYLAEGAAATDDLPTEVLVPSAFPDMELLAEILSRKAGRRVRTRVPVRGAGADLVRLAVANARNALEDAARGSASPARAGETLYELQDYLGLKVVPRLLACLDVSHTQGADAVAGVATLKNGEPWRAGYRRMRIRQGKGDDDYRSMAEAVGRYVDHAVRKGARLPDLVLVDGGKGQLGAAQAALEAAGAPGVALAAIAKKEEVAYVSERSAGIRIPRTSPSLYVLQRARDEAHRIAVGYNRKLRSRRTVRSRLAEIPGIGPKRQQALLSRFGSVRGVRGATAEEIGRIPGFSEAAGVRILSFLNRAPP